MAIVNISLSDQMKKYIEERIGAGGYNTTSEYFSESGSGGPEAQSRSTS